MSLFSESDVLLFVLVFVYGEEAANVVEVDSMLVEDIFGVCHGIEGLHSGAVVTSDVMNELPDFIAEDACFGEEEFLGTGVVSIGGEGTEQGGTYACFEADSGNKNHLNMVFDLLLISYWM